MSVRSLGRHFKEQTGTTPLQWLLKARVRRAQALLETTPLSIERVASGAGFGSVAAFRQHFHRVAGTSPQAYRRAFQCRGPGQPIAGERPSSPPRANGGPAVGAAGPTAARGRGARAPSRHA
jgi:AraC-like DNA-binding protein